MGQAKKYYATNTDSYGGKHGLVSNTGMNLKYLEENQKKESEKQKPGVNKPWKVEHHKPWSDCQFIGEK